MGDLQKVKSSFGWIEVADLTAVPTDTDSNRAGFCVVNGVPKYWNGSAWVSFSGSSAVGSLDNAYDDGSTVSVDTNAIQFAGATGIGAKNVLELRMTGAGTGNMLDIQNDSSGSMGYDIIGTDDSWSISAAGVIVATALTLGDDQAITLGASSDATIQWVNASSYLDIGGATNFDGNMTIEAAHSLTIAGAAGADKLTVTAGDVVLGEGSLTMTDDDNAATLKIVNDGATTVGAASSTGVVDISCASLTTGALLHLSTTEGTLNGGFFIRAWAETAAGAVFTVGENGATVIAGAAAGTTAFTMTAGDLFLSDTDASIIESEDGTGTMLTLDNKLGVIASDTAVLLIDAGGAVASGGNLLRIAPTGTPNAGAIGIEYVGASKAMTAMVIDGDPTASSVVTINGGGAMTDGIAVLALTNDGNLATGGNILAITMGGTPHTAACALEVTAAKDAIAMTITTSAATQSAVQITGAGAIADNKALVHIIGSGTPAAAGSNLLRVEFTGTATNKPVLAEIVGTGKDVSGIYSVTDNTTTHGVSIAGAGALATGGRMLHITNTGTPAANTDAVAEITFGGTATNNPVVLNVNNGTADALPLYANSNVASATREVAQFVQDSTTGANECLLLKQDDVDQAFIEFTTTIGVGNGIEAVGAKTLTTSHFIKVNITGVGALYFPVGTIA